MLDRFARRLYIVNDRVAKAEGFLLVVMMALLVAVMTWQVLCRYFFGIPTPWSEELLRYTFIAMAFIGSGYGIFKGEHIVINIIDTVIIKLSNDRDPERVFIILSKIMFAIIVVFLIYYIQVYTGYVGIINTKRQLSASMFIPMWIPMSSGVIGMALMLFHAVSGILIPDRIWKGGAAK
jgi:C4-dicarboxylate transporter DctQ subunit